MFELKCSGIQITDYLKTNKYASFSIRRVSGNWYKNECLI